MFYTKAKIGEAEIRLPLYDDEIYTTCDTCGREIAFDSSELADLIVNGGDLASTTVTCENCTASK